jgi:hypothetical protein
MAAKAWGYRIGCTLDRLALILQQRRRGLARNTASTNAPSGPRSDRHATSAAIPVAPDIPSKRWSWPNVFGHQPRAPLRRSSVCMALLGRSYTNRGSWHT